MALKAPQSRTDHCVRTIRQERGLGALGYLPSELIRGCPVLPRWRLSSQANNTILLAAYLRQPIILVGHHRDLRDGIELLGQLARFINSLGAVRWSNLNDLSRSNYQWRMEGVTCKLKPLGRRIFFPLPKQAAQLIVESPYNGFWKTWKISATASPALTVAAGECVSLPRPVDGMIFIEPAFQFRSG